MIGYEEVAHGVTGYEPLQENTCNRHSISVAFSLQILAREGFSVHGDITMQKTANIPQRASKPVTPDIEQQYDDDSAGTMPRSAIRYRSSTEPTHTLQEPMHTRTTDVLPRTSNRVSGSTRAGLVVLLILCCLFLVNGIVVPAITSMVNTVKYGTAQIATYDLNGRHWITEEENGRVRIVVSNEDGSHNQVLTTMISNAPKHALVSLSQDGAKIDVSINGAYITALVSDNHGGYAWSNA